MAIKQLIAHRLCKTSPTSPSSITLRKEPLNLDGRAEELCRELKNTFIRKAGKVYGGLSDQSAEFPIKSWLTQYIEEKIGFPTLCANVLQQLKLQLDKTESVLDSHVVCFFESLEGGDAFYLAVTGHNHAQFLDGELNLCDTRFLDTQDIHLAAKIKIPEMLGDEQLNCLSIVRWRGEKEISEAFMDAMGFANKVDLAADTSQFLELVTEYTKNLPEEEAKVTQKQVVEYCLEQDKTGQPVSIQALSSEISTQDRPPLRDYAKQIRSPVKEELIPDKSQLRNYVRISGRNEQLSMSFASACLGKTVVYDPETDTITIRDLPAGLKSKLVQHLRKDTGKD